VGIHFKKKYGIVVVLLALIFLSLLGSNKPATAAEAKKPAPAVEANKPATPAEANKPSTAGGTADTLVVAMPSYFEETFLPWNGSTMRLLYLGTINEFLVYRDPKTEEPKPGLATKWEMSKDGKTWTFWLRQGVKFHENWGEFTSADVKYTFERQMAKDSKASTASELRALVASVEAPEPYKVVFRLLKPDIEFVSSETSDGSQQVIACKKYVETVGDEKANEHPIGTGPYTLAEYRARTSIKLTTVPGVEKHWRVNPAFQTITFLRVPDEPKRIAMLKAGEVDLAPISYDSIDTVKASGAKIITIPNNWVPNVRLGGLVMTDPTRYKKNPWADKRVRQAMNYAIDKETIVEILFRGMATPVGADLPFLEWLDIKPYPYDPKKAKKLLAEAGYPKGFSVTMKTYKTTPGAELPIVGEAIAMYWKEIGINVKIVPTDYGTVRAAWTGGKATDYIWVHRGMAFAGIVGGLQVAYSAKNQFACYVTKETEARITQIENEFDLKKKSVLLRQFGEYLREEAPFVFVASVSEPYGASKKVGQWPTPRIRPQNFEWIKR
jgi:peptide/nickel transport system substrate-binding protein